MYTLTCKGKRAHFLAMPRTGSKACRDALKEIGAEIVGGHHNIDKFDEVVQPGDLVISTVRNHWDWFVSFWYLNGCPGRFDRYVPKLCRTSEWIQRNSDTTVCKLFWKYAPLSTVVLRYERLGMLGLHLINEGFPGVMLKQNGTPKPQPYQYYYKQGTREYIASRFKDEIEMYGYKF